MRQLFLLLIILSSLSCRKFVWDNPNDTINPSTEPASLKEGLVAYYPFNGNANDESGNGNNGNVNGATLTKDRFGNDNSSYYFDGIQDRIYIDGTNSFPIGSNARSISLWLKVSGQFNINQLGTNSITYGSTVEFGRFSDNSRFGLLLTPKRELYIVCNFNDKNSEYSLAMNDWRHVVVTASGSNLKIYSNGKLIFSSFLARSMNTGSGFFSIGNTMNDPASSFQNEAFNGNIDDIRIYNRALTQEEITYLSNN